MPFLKDDELQKQFEESFDYQPTKDQLIATSQIKRRYGNPHPMDRLLVGDVGFGKTEVAFRAIFKSNFKPKTSFISLSNYYFFKSTL